MATTEPLVRSNEHRAIELMDAARRFISENGLEEHTIVYDEATCDGQCLIDDLNVCIEDMEADHGKER